MLKNIKSKKKTYKVEKQGRIVKEQFFTKTISGTESNIRDMTKLIKDRRKEIQERK